MAMSRWRPCNARRRSSAVSSVSNWSEADASRPSTPPDGCRGRVGPQESRPTKVMKARVQRVAGQLEGREGDGQGEPARARTSRIKVEDAARGLDLRAMRMPRDDHVDPGGGGVEIQVLEVVKHMDGPAAERQAGGVGVALRPPARV